MSKLSVKEESGCRRLLTMLPKDDLLALKDTVTNRLIAVESAEEAVQAIITYSQDAEELLKRKKVHRDVIFKYLANEGVAMPPNAQKYNLVRRTLELWSSEENTTQVQPVQNWGPQRFWQDVRLRLLLHAGEQRVEEFNGAELVSRRLHALVGEERLLFCPNLEGLGLKCVSSPHGFVLVAVAGTIHRDSVWLGIFEQAFGLIRSPLDSNRWKIKFVNVKVEAQSAITDRHLPVITYDSNELLSLCN
ncbi:uncharacterized protein C3orf38-like isoform X2 [Xyrauchen texanus]|uniref:uncharacterized protein C3orf38-like isoform X2 n=1 Tax=Xyrauchen texanus TaxID=154827 RepID=UPI0022420937|nr:uncharacterized protein C3orf38-like isoform X2 [Xyrauchen texanus]